MSSSQVPVLTLFDSASRPGKELGWNPLVMRIRYLLNIKRIPHKTVYLDYPDIEPILRKIGAKPTGTWTGSEKPFYSIPVLLGSSHLDDDGKPTVVSDSWAIAEYIDRVSPTPVRVIPEGMEALQWMFQNYAYNDLYLGALAPILVPHVLPFLNRVSHEYWNETRSKFFDKAVDQLCPKFSAEWDTYWNKVYSALDKLSFIYDKNGTEDNTLVVKGQITYGDIVLVSFLDSIFILVPEAWEQVKVRNGGRWGKLRESFTQWRVFT